MRASQRAAHGAALFLVLSSAAVGCPVADDLEDGIAFVQADGDSLFTQALGENILKQQGFDRSGTPDEATTDAKYGLYLLSSEGPDWRTRYEWPAGLNALPHPQLGLSEDLALLITQRQVTLPAIFSIDVGDTPAGLKLSGCDMEIWGVRTRVQLDDDNSFSTFSYWFPALGTAVPAHQNVNGEVTETIEYVGMEW